MSENKNNVKQLGAYYMITSKSGGGKTTATKDLNNALYIYADSHKAFSFKKPHVNVYPFGAFRVKSGGKTVNNLPKKAVEYEGMNKFKSALIGKLKAYKEIKGSYPETVVFDAITNVYKMINDYIKQTTKNVYGSHSTDTARDVDDFLSWVHKVLLSKGINVIFTAHTVVNQETGLEQVATTGSKTFENVGSFFGQMDYVSYIHIQDGVRLISHKDLNHPTVCRSLLEDVAELEPIEDFNCQEMIDKIKAQSTIDEDLLI